MKLNTFKEKFVDNIYIEHQIAKYTWFGVGGNAEILYIPEEEVSLEKFLKEKPSDCNVFTIGAGSNLLVRDNGIDGITLITNKMNKISIDEDGIITANCGAIDAQVARFAREHNRTGLEFLIGIPGTIGGGIKMNSGAFGSEFKDVLIDVKAINHNGEYKTFSNKELKMEYRKIGLENKWIFLSARFKTSHGTKEFIREKMKKIIHSRKAAQPSAVKTGGSTFKNPPAPGPPWPEPGACAGVVAEPAPMPPLRWSGGPGLTRRLARSRGRPGRRSASVWAGWRVGMSASIAGARRSQPFHRRRTRPK